MKRGSVVVPMMEIYPISYRCMIYDPSTRRLGAMIKRQFGNWLPINCPEEQQRSLLLVYYHCPPFFPFSQLAPTPRTLILSPTCSPMLSSSKRRRSSTAACLCSPGPVSGRQPTPAWVSVCTSPDSPSSRIGPRLSELFKRSSPRGSARFSSSFPLLRERVSGGREVSLDSSEATS